MDACKQTSESFNSCIFLLGFPWRGRNRRLCGMSVSICMSDFVWVAPARLLRFRVEYQEL